MTSISTQPAPAHAETPPPRRGDLSPGELTSVVPIVPGFHPDPSVCRAGDDYYMANSSFEYSAGGAPLAQPDLLDMDARRQRLDRPDQFPPGHAGSSQGVYAPTLRHHDGQVLADHHRRVRRGRAARGLRGGPRAGRGPPRRALRGLHGIDPDLAWDEDGTCCVTYCSTRPGRAGIAQARVDLEPGTVLEEPRPLWSGTGLAYPEAPHLYRRGAYWYLIIAEGGTERGHGVSVARAIGPRVRTPARRTTRVHPPQHPHPVQNTGHADLVENADGTWAVVYLGVRPRGDTPMFHVNGRETFLAGIDWIDDWPVVDETRYRRPVLDTSYTDAFDATALHPRWVSPGAGLAQIATPAPAGGLQLRPGTGPRADVGALTARVLDLSWRFEADLGLTSGSAALLLRLDDTHWCEIRADAGQVHAVVRIGPLETPHGTAVPLAGPSLTLRAEALAPTTNGPDDVRLSAVFDGTEHELARFDGRYLSTEVAGGFTGRVVGLRALVGVVDVAEVRYTPLR